MKLRTKLLDYLLRSKKSHINRSAGDRSNQKGGAMGAGYVDLRGKKKSLKQQMKG